MADNRARDANLKQIADAVARRSLGRAQDGGMEAAFDQLAANRMVNEWYDRRGKNPDGWEEFRRAYEYTIRNARRADEILIALAAE